MPTLKIIKYDLVHGSCMIGYMYCMFFSTFQSGLARLCAFLFVGGIRSEVWGNWSSLHGSLGEMGQQLCIVLTSIFHTYWVLRWKLCGCQSAAPGCSGLV